MRRVKTTTRRRNHTWKSISNKRLHQRQLAIDYWNPKNWSVKTGRGIIISPKLPNKGVAGTAVKITYQYNGTNREPYNMEMVLS